MFIDADGKKHFVGSSIETNPIKTGKEKTYTSRTKPTFWFDVNTHTIWTERDDIFVHEHESDNREEPGYAFILHIEGRAIAFSKSPEKKFTLTSGDRADGTRFWEFGHIGEQYEKRTKTLKIAVRKNYKMTNANKFADTKQQEFALTLLKDILSNFTGNWLGLAHGTEQSAEVVLTKELREKIEDGHFVEGLEQ